MILRFAIYPLAASLLVGIGTPAGKHRGVAAAPSPAVALTPNYKGFKAGMTLDEALAHAKSMGVELRQDSSLKNMYMFENTYAGRKIDGRLEFFPAPSGSYLMTIAMKLYPGSGDSEQDVSDEHIYDRKKPTDRFVKDIITVLTGSFGKNDYGKILKGGNYASYLREEGPVSITLSKRNGSDTLYVIMEDRGVSTKHTPKTPEAPRPAGWEKDH